MNAGLPGITSGLVFSEWERIFANPIAAAAAIDREEEATPQLPLPMPAGRFADPAPSSHSPPEGNHDPHHWRSAVAGTAAPISMGERDGATLDWKGASHRMKGDFAEATADYDAAARLKPGEILTYRDVSRGYASRIGLTNIP